MEKRLVISSIVFKTIERFSVKAIGLIVSIILARMLSPGIFGQIAVIMVFVNLSHVFVLSGLNTALVQRKDVTIIDYSTVFYISFCIALLFLAMIWCFAPIIARYYSYSHLVLPLRVYSCTLPIGAINSIQIAKAQKEMRFRQMMIANLVSAMLAGGIGVVLAYFDMGIWALIVYYASNTVLVTIGMCFVTKWWPSCMFSLQRAKVLFSYGWRILVAALLCSLYADIRTLIIGKRFSDADLGYYNKGQQFPDVIATSMDVAIQSVMLPTLAVSQDHIEHMRQILRRSMSFGLFFIMPVMFFLSSSADSFIHILLTDKWEASIPYMQILCISNAFVPLLTSNLTAIKAVGRSDLFMKLEVVRRIIMLVILMVAVFCFHSVYAIAVSWMVNYIIDVVIVMIPVKGILGYGPVEQFKDLWRTLVASALMFVGVYLIGELLVISHIWKFSVQLITAVALYVTISLLLRNEILTYIFNGVRRFIKTQKEKK